MNSIFLMWFLLGVFPYNYSLEYLNFDGTKEESKQALYYMSVDGGANANPTDELTRTQRSFWNLLNNGLFRERGSRYNDCNYNEGNRRNYNSGNSLLPLFQSWRPLPLWKPLQPLFENLNQDNNRCENSKNFGTNTYGDNSIETSSYDSSEPSVPLYEIPAEPVEPNYQLADSPISQHHTTKPHAKIKTKAYVQPKASQTSIDKVPQIIYQPIIYVSPQHQENKPLNREIFQEEQPQLFSSIADKNKLRNNNDYSYKASQKNIPEVDTTCSQPVSCSQPPVASSNSNYIPLNNYPSNLILLTEDDQPYRVCPELFTDYDRKIKRFLLNMYSRN